MKTNNYNLSHWISRILECKLVFTSKLVKSLDCHGEMNTQNFKEQFIKTLTSSEEPPYNVMNNSPYHPIVLDKIIFTNTHEKLNNWMVFKNKGLCSTCVTEVELKKNWNQLETIKNTKTILWLIIIASIIL